MIFKATCTSLITIVMMIEQIENKDLILIRKSLVNFKKLINNKTSTFDFMSPYFIGGAGGGLLLVILLIVLICCLCKKKTVEEEKPKELEEKTVVVEVNEIVDNINPEKQEKLDISASI